MKEINDPVERTSAYRKIRPELERKIETQISAYGYPPGVRFLGWCHLYWDIKKQVLKSDYNIDWKSPAELNPTTMYD